MLTRTVGSKCNYRRLKKSYELLTKSFEAAGLRYMPACAAMFCWLDLRNLLAEVFIEVSTLMIIVEN